MSAMTVMVTENYTARRFWWGNRTHIQTIISYKTGSDRIHISTCLGFNSDLEATWPRAEVNWAACGSQLPEDTAEYSVALRWAAREATRIDKEIQRRIQKGVMQPARAVQAEVRSLAEKAKTTGQVQTMRVKPKRSKVPPPAYDGRRAARERAEVGHTLCR